MASSRNVPRYVNKKVFVTKLQATAEFPYLDIEGTVAYNLTLIARTDSRSEDNHLDINNFHTGIVISSLPEDSYLEIIPHPSLYKNGYMLPGNIIIDKSHTGEIIIPLYKYKDVECLELPFPAVQFIVREHVPVHISSDDVKKKDDYPLYNQLPTVIYQAESSINREPSYKGASRNKNVPKKGNHMF